VSAMQEAASEQRAVLASALLQGNMSPDDVAALQTAQSAQSSDQKSFNLAASVGQLGSWNNSVNRSYVPLANSEELQALAIESANQGSLRTDPVSAFDWYGAMSNSVDIQMGSVEKTLTNQIIARAKALRKSAITAAVIIGAG